MYGHSLSAPEVPNSTELPKAMRRESNISSSPSLPLAFPPTFFIDAETPLSRASAGHCEEKKKKEGDNDWSGGGREIKNMTETTCYYTLSWFSQTL